MEKINKKLLKAANKYFKSFFGVAPAEVQLDGSTVVMSKYGRVLTCHINDILKG